MVCGNKDDWGVCKDLNDVGVEKECPKAKHKSCYMIVHCKLNKKDYLFYISVTCDLKGLPISMNEIFLMFLDR